MNEWLHPAFGKVLFVAADIAIGYLISSILLMSKYPRSVRVLACTLWTFNPIAINVSTRGNADSLVGLCVLATLYYLMQNNLTLAAIMCVSQYAFKPDLTERCRYGLSVHLKIYPVIYSVTLVLFLARSTGGSHLSVRSILLSMSLVCIYLITNTTQTVASGNSVSLV